MNQAKNINPEDRFTRTLFGIIMIISSFIIWGKWVTFVLGILFLISAKQEYYVTCAVYKKVNNK